MYLLYNLAIWLGSPLLILWVAYRTLRGRLPGLAQRLGFLAEQAVRAPFGWAHGPELVEGRLQPCREVGEKRRALAPEVPAKLADGSVSFSDKVTSSHSGPVAWFHAVSLGEVKVAASLINELRKRVAGVRIIITSSTRTGWEEARRRAAPGDTVLFPPMDYAWICRRFLRRLRPDVVVVLETELWPNLFREVKRSGASLLLVNGRISDRSFPRYLATRLFWCRVLVYPDALFPQSERDADRFRTLGAPLARVRVAGNLKFAARPATSPFVETLRARLRESGAGPILVAGSTMPGEEKYLLDAFLQLRHEFPTLFMVLAPRHPERFAGVAEEVRLSGIPLQLRSQWVEATASSVPGILLLDSTGELGSMYALATVAFVGGTLASTGGHNILEPAHFACPTVIGPSMENFREIARQFLESKSAGRIPGDGIRTGTVVQVQDASGLVTALRYLFANPAFAKRLGESARDLANEQLSGLEPLLQELKDRLTRKHVAKAGQNLPGHETSVSAEKWQEVAK